MDPKKALMIAGAGLAILIVGVLVYRVPERQGQSIANSSTFPSPARDAPARTIGASTPEEGVAPAQRTPLSFSTVFSKQSAPQDDDRPTETNSPLIPAVKTAPPSARSPSFDLSSAYFFSPRGLVATSSAARARTAAQEALFDYGNAAGSAIASFDGRHGNMRATLKDFFDDRANPPKAAALSSLGSDYGELGERLLAMENVPQEVTVAHGELAEGYRGIGAGLSALTGAGTDAELLEKIAAYNASADELTKRFLAMGMIFSAHDVSFGKSDAGYLFTYRP